MKSANGLPDLQPNVRMVSDNEAERRFAHGVRIAEALLFASHQPLSEEVLARHMPMGVTAAAVLSALEKLYRSRGVHLMRLAGKWQFRTAPDLAFLLREEGEEPRKLSRAALEILAVIAYHQPVTRAEIEEWRGVSCYRGTLDALIDAGFVRMRGRRRSPGRPVTYGTSEAFLIQFGLDRIEDLPPLEEIAAAGLSEIPLPAGLITPIPVDDPALRADEDALEEDVGALIHENYLDEVNNLPPLGEEEEAPARG